VREANAHTQPLGDLAPGTAFTTHGRHLLDRIITHQRPRGLEKIILPRHRRDNKPPCPGARIVEAQDRESPHPLDHAMPLQGVERRSDLGATAAKPARTEVTAVGDRRRLPSTPKPPVRELHQVGQDGSHHPPGARRHLDHEV